MGMGDCLLAILLFVGFDYVIRGGGGMCGGVMVAGELNCVSSILYLLKVIYIA